MTRSWTWLRARHEALRTTFDGRGSNLVQQIHDPVPLPVAQVEVRDAGEEEAALDAEMRADLTTEPVRVTVISRASEDHILCVNADHLVTDTWSANVLGLELAAVYKALCRGREPELGPSGWQYRDFAAWQAERLSGANLARLQQAWHERLAGAEPIAPQSSTGNTAAAERFALAASDLAGATQLARARRVTVTAVVLAAFWSALRRTFGRDDITVGSVVANRTRPEVRTTVGPFAHLVLLRGRLQPEMTFSAVVETAQAVLGHALAHQELPGQMLAPETLRTRADLVGGVVLNVWPGRKQAGPGPLPSPLAGGLGTQRFGLEFGLWLDAAQPRGLVRFTPEQFPPDLVRALVEEFQSSLSRGVAAPTGVG